MPRANDRATRTWPWFVAAGTAALGATALPVLAADAPRRVSGPLEACGGGHCIGDHRVDFGPGAARDDVVAGQDFDGDGSVEVLAREIDGLMELPSVMLEVGRDRGVDVLTVQGLPYVTRDDPPPAPDAAAEPMRPQEVPAEVPRQDGTTTDTLAGTLVECGSGLCVQGGDREVPVDFGPMWWLQDTVLEDQGDLDGDGTLETLAEEIAGLVGTPVVVRVEDADGRDADVHLLNGVRYRGDTDRPPDWAGGPGPNRAVGPPGPRPPWGEPRGPHRPPEDSDRPGAIPTGPPDDVPPGPHENGTPGPPGDGPPGPADGAPRGNGVLGGPPPGGPGGEDTDHDGGEPSRPPQVGGPPGG